jgi:hypothetical protein
MTVAFEAVPSVDVDDDRAGTRHRAARLLGGSSLEEKAGVLKPTPCTEATFGTGQPPTPFSRSQASERCSSADNKRASAVIQTRRPLS